MNPNLPYCEQCWLLMGTVVSAYQDGKTTLDRIKAKREARGRPLELRSIQDLESSLVLGPVIVQGQYDSDFRRFGQVRRLFPAASDLMIGTAGTEWADRS